MAIWGCRMAKWWWLWLCCRTCSYVRFVLVKQQLWGDLASQYLILSKNMVIGYTKVIREFGNKNIRERNFSLRDGNIIGPPRNSLYARRGQQDFMIYENLLLRSRLWSSVSAGHRPTDGMNYGHNYFYSHLCCPLSLVPWLNLPNTAFVVLVKMSAAAATIRQYV